METYETQLARIQNKQHRQAKQRALQGEGGGGMVPQRKLSKIRKQENRNRSFPEGERGRSRPLGMEDESKQKHNAHLCGISWEPLLVMLAR